MMDTFCLSTLFATNAIVCCCVTRVFVVVVVLKCRFCCWGVKILRKKILLAQRQRTCLYALAIHGGRQLGPGYFRRSLAWVNEVRRWSALASTKRQPVVRVGNNVGRFAAETHAAHQTRGRSVRQCNIWKRKRPRLFIHYAVPHCIGRGFLALINGH